MKKTICSAIHGNSLTTFFLNLTYFLWTDFDQIVVEHYLHVGNIFVKFLLYWNRRYLRKNTFPD